MALRCFIGAKVLICDESCARTAVWLCPVLEGTFHPITLPRMHGKRSSVHRGFSKLQTRTLPALSWKQTRLINFALYNQKSTTMKRIQIKRIQPAAYDAMNALENYVANSTIDKIHQELLKIR